MNVSSRPGIGADVARQVSGVGALPPVRRGGRCRRFAGADVAAGSPVRALPQVSRGGPGSIKPREKRKGDSQR